MSRRVQENIASALLLLLFIGILWIASGYGPRARMVPTIIAWMGLGLTIGQIILFNTRGGAAMKVDLLEVISARATGDDESISEDLRHDIESVTGNAPEEPEGTGFFEHRGTREIFAIGVVGVAMAMFFIIGPIWTMLFYTFGYFVISRHYNLWQAAAFSLTFTILVYALFYVWLRVDIEVGLLNLNPGLW
ncbi:MAG: tripartite tricarboxylate transporter TctB family protein [Rhodobiaceae bacterium]|nr:tripartite tricarboxylate transporter TctB family protein [Rhodobiaceae bacterium]